MYIRKYSHADKDKVLDIYSLSKLDELRFEQNSFSLLPLELDKARWNSLFESNIVVFDNGCIKGYGAFYKNEVRSLFVHPNYRATGIGKQILGFMLSKIHESASLHVASSNLPAIDMYRRFGFVSVSEFETEYNGVSVLATKMVKCQSSC